MSASERLRALAERAGSKESWFDARLEAVDALPLIADVVEAAERSAQFEAGLGHYPICADALTALREHLEGDTP